MDTKTITMIQRELRAPKDKQNEYGHYSYRNCETIYEALKPILAKYNATLTLSDSITSIEGVIMLVATATLEVDGKTYQSTGCAMHALEKKGMDPAQITGACSSYARKYALCGLFLIDGGGDPDATNTGNDTPTVRRANPYTAQVQRGFNNINI